MIISVWVFFMLGEPTPSEPGTAYVQYEAKPWMHDKQPEVIEAACRKEYAEKYRTHPVYESGWKRQEIKVMGDG